MHYTAKTSIPIELGRVLGFAIYSADNQISAMTSLMPFHSRVVINYYRERTCRTLTNLIKSVQ